MRSFLSNILPDYSLRHIALGGLITAGLVLILIYAGTSYFILNPKTVSQGAYILTNTLGFGLCWLLITSLLNRLSVFKILAVVGLMAIGLGADRLMEVEDNPITVPAMTLFWVGVGYLILPQFFKKYRVAILAVYGFVISYYLFVFLTSPEVSVDSRLTFTSLILVPLPVFAALWGYEQWRWLQGLQADKAKAELALLKSQVDPHFFFNTLNNLYGLVVEKSEQAPDVVLRLADMMRYTIYEGKKDKVSLTDEVAYLQTYIELHKIRYQKKVEIHFSPQIDPGIEVAPLLFIILLENAFKHGVEPMTEDAFIHMDLTAQREEIKFKIENNYTNNSPTKKGGIGLDNLRKRLAYLYPSKHTLTLKQTDLIYTATLHLKLS